MVGQIFNMEKRMISALLAAIPNCQAIYRFGTWMTEDERPDSDIDLAVLPSAPLEPVFRWELAQRLAIEARRDVDLIDLLRASTVLRMQVVAHGQRIYCADLNRVEVFEDYVYSGYARLNEERREILADVRERGNVYGK
jgi:uncharacterized protein